MRLGVNKNSIDMYVAKTHFFKFIIVTSACFAKMSDIFVSLHKLCVLLNSLSSDVDSFCFAF